MDLHLGALAVASRPTRRASRARAQRDELTDLFDRAAANALRQYKDAIGPWRAYLPVVDR